MSYLCYSLSGKFVKGASVKIDDNRHLILRNDKIEDDIVLINEEDFTVESYTFAYFSNIFSSSTSNPQSSINYDIGYDYKTNTCIGCGSNRSYMALARFLPYSSHTKLPNPVTKTNTTTMKITYDYYIQLPNLFAESGNEFSWD